MSISSVAFETRRAPWVARLTDYAELTKPKIAALVLVTEAVAGFVVGWPAGQPLVLLNALAGTALIAASASALNQWLERESDAQMERTAGRPLPAGRLTPREVLLFGLVTALAGAIHLTLSVNALTAGLGLLTWTTYVWIYTPMKSRTPANTCVGAVAGALPGLMGCAAVGAPLDVRAFTLFLIVFLWQFPHFMAIAWIYREQYSAAGLQMLTVVDSTGRRAGAQAIVSALALLPVSLVPVLLHVAGGFYFGATLLLGLAQLACAVAFLVRLDERAARRLLRASLVYLPAVMFLLLLAPLM